MQHNVAIVIPTYKQYAELSASEQLSLHRTYEVLRAHDFVFITHAGIDLSGYPSPPGPGRVWPLVLPPGCFKGLNSYSQLLLSREFYQSFAAYDYLLVCQLDVYVFADQLPYFTGKGYDYIGAPWFEGYDQADAHSALMGVGNGGFSLRKVESFLAVLDTLELFSGRRPTLCTARAGLRHIGSILRVAKHEYYRRVKGRAYEPALPWDVTIYEDGYWGLMVKIFFPWFRVASLADATAFAFEVNPRVLYELNQHQLPMATHAWEKYDPEFWQSYIQS